MTSTRTHLLFADSKNRDVGLFPSGNSYVLHLTTPIKDTTWSVPACPLLNSKRKLDVDPFTLRRLQEP